VSERGPVADGSEEEILGFPLPQACVVAGGLARWRGREYVFLVHRSPLLRVRKKTSDE